MKWKKLVLAVLVLLLGVLTLSAQGKAPYPAYCTITVGRSSMSSYQVTVQIDYGQYANPSSDDREIVDETGYAIRFNSLAEAANYLSKLGWKFEYVYTTQRDNRSREHWVLSKMVTDDSQIAQGIRTHRYY